MPARIAGLGQWIPDTIRTNAAWPPDFAELARVSERRELIDVPHQAGCRADEIALRYMDSEAKDPFLGATERRIAEPAITAPEAEARAARRALEEAGIAATELDAVISWAIVPERISPPSAPRVAYLIGATNAYAVGMDVACASSVAQIAFAAALIESGRAKNVLLTQSHLLTRAFKLIHPASPSVGDAATAVVVTGSSRPSIMRMHARSDGSLYEAVTWCRGAKRDPPWWQPGSAYYLGSRDIAAAQELVRSTVRTAAETIAELAALHDVSLSDLDLLACVQPRRWIPGAIVEALGTNMLAPHTFDRLAHLGGCGVITNLIAARASGQLFEGSRVVLYAQGAGFTRAAMLIHW
jgi:3-oxoacyl-[acyl-carrier-protein] synthase III